jgi:hypothetical protein
VSPAARQLVGLTSPDSRAWMKRTPGVADSDRDRLIQEAHARGLRIHVPLHDEMHLNWTRRE